MPDASFEALVATHGKAVFRVCRSIVRDEHLGADAAQETFLRLWKELRAGRAPRRFGAWLQRVAVTTSIDLLRRGRPEEPLAARDEPASARTPEHEAGDRELEARLERALATLSDGQRTVFLLRHSAGMPLAQAAESLGVSLPTVKTQFARACLKLQEALRSFEPRRREETR